MNPTFVLLFIRTKSESIAKTSTQNLRIPAEVCIHPQKDNIPIFHGIERKIYLKRGIDKSRRSGKLPAWLLPAVATGSYS